MAELERLNAEQLLKLESLLIEQEAPLIQRFAPPATDVALAVVESQLGLALPDELRQWWGWHDGTNVKAQELAVESSIGPSFDLMSSVEAVEVSRRLRSEAEEEAPGDPDSLWASSWIAIGSQGRVACECNIAVDAPVPVLDVDYHKAVYPGAVVCHSVGKMVGWWIEALESGAWRYDTERQRWQRRYELIAPERDQAGLV